ncbi:SLBB domain-containing protein [Oryzomonas sagensis]|nr:SLBB domain-containing protein [Oryzomonas sagensis]
MKRRNKVLVLACRFIVLMFCAHLALPGTGASATTPASAESSRPMDVQGKSVPQAAQQGQPLSPQPSGQAPTPLGTVPRAPGEKSDFERYVSGKSPAAISLDIGQFGYDLFAKPPSTFAPSPNVPVGPDYVVGPGDAIKIDVWGRFEGNWSVVVNNDGTISLPKIGVFGVAGVSFKELKELLHKKFSKYYGGFDMNVSLGPLRTIQVYVVGNAQRPGAYTISSLSTVINALFESGGPLKTGSMRNIQVKRNGKTVVTFDLYDLLLQGDKTRDLRLMPEDVIFIPPVGPLAGIAGTVNTPAIYELKGETRLLDLIAMAGGITGTAYKGRVQIQRTEDHHSRIVFEGDLLDIEHNPAKNLVLQDSDLAKIFAVADNSKTVTVTGAVANPGEYGVTPGVTTVKDIISLAGGLLYYTSDQAEMTRVTATQSGPKTDIFSIDLAKALAGAPQHNVPLQTNDYLLVRTIPEWSIYRTAAIKGEVRFPGTYTFKQGEPLSSLIERAGGFTPRAYLRGAMFTRERVREQQQRQINEMAERLERELSGAGAAQVATASSPDDARMVQFELEQKRQFIAQLKAARAKGRIALNITEMTTFRGSAYDIELEQGDTITVPSDPKTVQVIGSVYNQSAFVYEQSKEYGYYVDLAGGYTSNADKGNVFILQANGTALKAGGSFLGFGQRLGSGDTVVVPEQLDRIAWMRNIKDITQIMYQIAVAAGVLIVVF